jgi:hypothetical protein
LEREAVKPRAPDAYGIVARKAIRNGPNVTAQAASVISCLRAKLMFQLLQPYGLFA